MLLLYLSRRSFSFPSPYIKIASATQNHTYKFQKNYKYDFTPNDNTPLRIVKVNVMYKIFIDNIAHQMIPPNAQ